MPPNGLDSGFGQDNNLNSPNNLNAYGENPNSQQPDVPQSPSSNLNQPAQNPMPDIGSNTQGNVDNFGSAQPPTNTTNFGQPDSSYNYSDIQFQPEQQQTNKGGKGLIVFLVIMLIIICAASVIIFGTSRGYFSIGLEKIWPAIAPEEKIETQPSTNSTQTTQNVGDLDLVKQRDVQRKQDLQALKIALKNYKNDTGSYPISEQDENLGIKDNKLQIALVSKYIKELPKDPLSPQYYYAYKSNGDTFDLICVLENTQDSDGELIGARKIYDLSSTSDSSSSSSSDNSTTQ